MVTGLTVLGWLLGVLFAGTAAAEVVDLPGSAPAGQPPVEAPDATPRAEADPLVLDGPLPDILEPAERVADRGTPQRAEPEAKRQDAAEPDARPAAARETADEPRTSGLLGRLIGGVVASTTDTVNQITESVLKILPARGDRPTEWELPDLLPDQKLPVPPPDAPPVAPAPQPPAPVKPQQPAKPVEAPQRADAQRLDAMPGTSGGAGRAEVADAEADHSVEQSMPKLPAHPKAPAGPAAPCAQAPTALDGPQQARGMAAVVTERGQLPTFSTTFGSRGLAVDASGRDLGLPAISPD